MKDEIKGGREGRRAVRQIEGHEGREIQAQGQGRLDTPPVVDGLGRGHHRRLEIGHDDGAGKAARRVGQDRGHLGPIAQMQVPIVGAGDLEFLGHDGLDIGLRAGGRRLERGGHPILSLG